MDFIAGRFLLNASFFVFSFFHHSFFFVPCGRLSYSIYLPVSFWAHENSLLYRIVGWGLGPRVWEEAVPSPEKKRIFPVWNGVFWWILSGVKRTFELLHYAIWQTVVQAVVKANSQSNGNGQNSTQGSETPERILMKLGIYDYMGGVWPHNSTHANPYGAATTWVVSENTWLVTCFGFLVYLFSFFTLLVGSCPARTSGPILTINTSWRFSAQGSAFWGSQWDSSESRGQIPQKTFWGREYAFSSLTRKILKLAYYRNSCIDSNQILQC